MTELQAMGLGFIAGELIVLVGLIYLITGPHWPVKTNRNSAYSRAIAEEMQSNLVYRQIIESLGGGHMDMKPKIGSIVRYMLTEQDAEQVNRRRVSNVGHAKDWPAGAQAHFGSSVLKGYTFPMIVTWDWRGGVVNGQVFLDGNDVLWVTSIRDGNGPGLWHWPVAGD